MIKRISCFLPVILLGIINCFAQQDSVYTDTVIVIKDPHIIKKQVHATDPVYTKTDTNLNWSLECFFLAGKSDFGKSREGLSLTNGSSYHAGILVTRNFHRLELGIGIGISGNSFTSTSSNQTGYFTNRDSSYTRVLDSYVQTVDGKDSTFYITEPADTTITSYSTSLRYEGSKNAFRYLEIPLSFGYRINLYKNKVSLIPRAQFIWGSLLSYTGHNLGILKKSIYKYGFQVNLSFDIIKHLAVYAKVQWQGSLDEIYPDVPDFKRWSTVQYGLGLAIKF